MISTPCLGLAVQRIYGLKCRRTASRRTAPTLDLDSSLAGSPIILQVTQTSWQISSTLTNGLRSLMYRSIFGITTSATSQGSESWSIGTNLEGTFVQSISSLVRIENSSDGFGIGCDQGSGHFHLLATRETHSYLYLFLFGGVHYTRFYLLWLRHAQLRRPG